MRGQVSLASFFVCRRFVVAYCFMFDRFLCAKLA
jgi:hypothetical protein